MQIDALPEIVEAVKGRVEVYMLLYLHPYITFFLYGTEIGALISAVH